jgi:hypothetical protein
VPAFSIAEVLHRDALRLEGRGGVLEQINIDLALVGLEINERHGADLAIQFGDGIGADVLIADIRQFFWFFDVCNG